MQLSFFCLWSQTFSLSFVPVLQDWILSINFFRFLEGFTVRAWIQALSSKSVRKLPWNFSSTMFCWQSCHASTLDFKSLVTVSIFDCLSCQKDPLLTCCDFYSVLLNCLLYFLELLLSLLRVLVCRCRTKPRVFQWFLSQSSHELLHTFLFICDRVKVLGFKAISTAHLEEVRDWGIPIEKIVVFMLCIFLDLIPLGWMQYKLFPLVYSLSFDWRISFWFWCEGSLALCFISNKAYCCSFRYLS